MAQPIESLVALEILKEALNCKDVLLNLNNVTYIEI